MTPSQNANRTSTELSGSSPLIRQKSQKCSVRQPGLSSHTTVQITRSLDLQDASFWVPTLVSLPREFLKFHVLEHVLRICKHLNLFFHLDISLSAVRLNSFKLNLRRNAVYLKPQILTLNGYLQNLSKIQFP